ncbi:fluoride efflux transporter CrcB [Robbsia sp. Bb-Pol-6]|uniref:Fluoride-specific ion channel FluC n=2 Tax=Robbsia betulipollinis TaxID=2981849 RepID=A0ABT3ZS17_9BURK|nr:fluoride efflux transporter CrcB [Robbsia betulipollinis]
MTEFVGLLAISLGAAIGAVARYGLSLGLNLLLPYMPLGTLAANLIAAFIVGAAIAFFGSSPNLSPMWRLFIITGLAGGLSTFSTFAAELLTLLREGRFGWSAAMLFMHVGGSLAATAAGILVVKWLGHR